MFEFCIPIYIIYSINVFKLLFSLELRYSTLSHGVHGCPFQWLEDTPTRFVCYLSYSYVDERRHWKEGLRPRVEQVVDWHQRKKFQILFHSNATLPYAIEQFCKLGTKRDTKKKVCAIFCSTYFIFLLYIFTVYSRTHSWPLDVHSPSWQASLSLPRTRT